MQNDTLTSLRDLSNRELLDQLKTLAGRERGATALLVAHIAELDRRDVFLREGYPSLFIYCRDGLGLSEHEALNRIEAARAAQRYPVIIELLSAGRVHLTAVRLLAPHLTTGNHLKVLADARGKTTQQIREMVARLAPQSDAPTRIRKLPAPSSAPPAGQPVVQPVVATGPQVVVSLSTPQPPPPIQQVASTAKVLPLSPDRYKLQLTIAGDTLEKLRLAKETLRHAIPAGDEAEILDRALTVLLTDLARKKFAATARPRVPQGSAPRTRYIAAEVKRAVWLRDLGRCAFLGATGYRC